MNFRISNWIKFSLLNLLLVAILGLLMRYKIGFELPFMHQKNIQHSHSHFAFSGWVSQTLFVLMVHFLSKISIDFDSNKYKKVLKANLVCAYIMLFSFIFNGYNFISIAFSTLSIFVSFWFAYLFLKDLKLIKKPTLSKDWFKASLFFNIISSFGTFALAFMMATKNIQQDYYLSSIYFYLHFQYNGWFWFACIGLFVGQLVPDLQLEKANRTIFKWFFISCIPAFLLSILWMKLPFWVYLIAIFAAILQIVAFIKFYKIIVNSFNSKFSHSSLFKYIYVSILLCVFIKLFLQLGSTVPLIGKLAFGFRPIVIAYLHLVLLAIISSFLLVYIYTNKLIVLNRFTRNGLVIFIIGIFLNEFVLAIQGIASFSYIILPYVNEVLLCIAFILFIGILAIVSFNRKEK
ncbi:hypothetical protein [Flavobacterium sp.]|uniref:hypothetical protein n=1 Tax=Flavobacterium sp. TaxID=239 RepID=UPI004047778B